MDSVIGVVNYFKGEWPTDCMGRIGNDNITVTREQFNQCVDELSKAEWMTKPEFTKEFRVLRGSEDGGEIWQKCKIVFTGKRYTVVENENGKEFSRKTAKIMIRDITPTIELIDGEAYQFDYHPKSSGIIGVYDDKGKCFWEKGKWHLALQVTNIKLLTVK